jgi:hypothetical protein
MTFIVKKTTLVNHNKTLIIEGILESDKQILVGDFFVYENHQFLIKGVLFPKNFNEKGYLGFVLSFNNEIEHLLLIDKNFTYLKK